MILLSSSSSSPFLNSVQAAIGHPRPAHRSPQAIGTSMMISFSVGLAAVLAACTYLVPEYPDPPGNVDESDGRDEDITGMSVPQRKTRVGDQMRESVGSAQESLLSVLIEPLLRLLNGRLQREGRGRSLLVVLQTLVQGLDLLLLALGEGLGLRARGESRNISLGGVDGGETDDR